MCRCKNHITKECLTCKRLFGVCKYKSETAKYCSRKCKRPSEDTIKAIIKANTGHTPWNKGMKGLQSWMDTSGLNKGQPWNKGKKGLQVAWNKGTKGLCKPNSGTFKKGQKLSKEYRDKISRSLKGKMPKNFYEIQKLGWASLHEGCLKGANHPNWRGGVTSENDKIRKSRDYTIWRTAVFMRDNYTCQICGEKGGTLNADHIKPFSLYPELRLAIDNGRTLCIECHKQTDTYLNKGKIQNAKNALA